MTTSSFVKVRILIVDDDSTCLSLVAAVLVALKHEVVTANHPMDALSILRARQQVFDLVLTDFHMPYMNGLELQKQVLEEFDLPVIIMSADDREAIMLRSLECGASFYIVKPLNLKNLQNVWQYVVAKKKERLSKSITIEEITDSEQETPAKHQVLPHQNNDESVSNAAAKKGKRKEDKLKQKEGGNKVGVYVSPRKPKIVWTNELHGRFLQVIDSLGLENAVPKRINELMNVPGLTRENVASHLQKYRTFLKKVSENGVQNLRDSKVALWLGIPPTLLSRAILQRSPNPLNLPQPLQQGPLLRLSSEKKDQLVETLNRRFVTTANFTLGLGYVRQLSVVSGETSAGMMSNNASDHLGPNCFSNTPESGHLMGLNDGVGNSSQDAIQQQPVNQLEILEVPMSGNCRENYRSEDKDWIDFMDSLLPWDEDCSWEKELKGGLE